MQVIVLSLISRLLPCPWSFSRRSLMHLLNHLMQGANAIGPTVAFETAEIVGPRLALNAREPRDRARLFPVDELLLAENQQRRFRHETLLAN